MTLTKNTIWLIVLIMIILLFFSFDNGSMMNSGTFRKLNMNDWLNGKSFGIMPAIITFGIGFLCAWLIFRRKK